MAWKYFMEYKHYILLNQIISNLSLHKVKHR